MDKLKLIGDNGFEGTEKDLDAMINHEIGYNHAIKDFRSKILSNLGIEKL